MTKISQRGVFLLALSYLSLLALGLTDNTRGPIFPQILQSFSLTQFQGALFFMVASGMSIISGFLAHRVLTRLGDVNTLRLGLFVLGLAQLVLYFSDRFSILLFGGLLFGVCLGLLGVAQNVLVLHASPPGTSQKWLSGLHSMYGISSILAPLLVNWIWAWGGGWQTPFLLILGLSILVFVLSFTWKTSKQSHQDETRVPARLSWQAFLFAGVLGFYVAFELLISTRLSLISQSIFARSPEASNLLTSAFFVFLTLGRVWIFFRDLPGSKIHQLAWCLILGWVSALLGIQLEPFFLALSGLFLAPIYGLSMALAGEKFGRQVSRVASLGVSLSGVAVVAMHWVVGLLSDQVGLVVAFSWGSLTALLSVLCLWFLQRERKHVPS